jgi:hypothetical protein
MKTYKTKTSEDLSDYELKEFRNKNVEWLVYHYEDGCYSGTGMAIWKMGGKYYFQSLSHCSCYGPTEGWQNNIPYSLDKIKVLLNKNYSYYKYNSMDVYNLITKHKLI